MDLPGLQGAECAAVMTYCKPFWNAADQVKAFRPKGDNLRKHMLKKKIDLFMVLTLSKYLMQIVMKCPG